MNFNFVFRTLIFSLLWIFISDDSFAQGRYYWSGKRKISLSVDSTSAFVLFKTSVDRTRLQNQSIVNKLDVSNEGKSAIVYFSSSQPDMRRSLNSIGFLDSQIESYQTGFKSLHNARVWLNDEIILEMKNGEPIENLKSLAQDFLIKKRDKYGVTVLKSTNRSIDAADVANKIYESGLVEYCHPNFVMEVVPENDPLYPDQYYLNNIGQIIDGSAGQSNIDVNGPEGWAVQVASPSIKVAVIDEGVEDHNDLRDANGNSRVLSGYTIGSPNGNGRPQFINRTHGQACAGILAASHNSIAFAALRQMFRLCLSTFLRHRETQILLWMPIAGLGRQHR